MFIFDFVFQVYQFLGAHPLVWQAVVTALATSGVFEYVKRKVELEGKARITSYMSLLSLATVLLHMAIIGATFKWINFGTQTFAYIGLLNVVYNFLTTKVAKFLSDAKAAAAATDPKLATSAQKNRIATSTAAAEVTAFLG